MAGFLVAVSVPIAVVAQPASGRLIEMVVKVKPAIVLVGTFKATNSPRFTLRGTGFIVGDGNFAVTNAHVIPDGAEADPDAKIVIQVRTTQNELQARARSSTNMEEQSRLTLLIIMQA